MTDQMTMIPEPEMEPEEISEEERATSANHLEFTSEDILDLVTSVDEDGHSPSYINASLDRIVDIGENTTLEDLTEENYEHVDSIQIEYVNVSFDSLDGEIATCILSFDTVNDAYLIELNEFLNRYKIMCKDYSMQENAGAAIPSFSMTFAPKALNGFGIMRISFPILYTRCLNDEGTNASMLIAFRLSNLEFSRLDISEEDLAELKADVYREVQSGTGGMLFEE